MSKKKKATDNEDQVDEVLPEPVMPEGEPAFSDGGSVAAHEGTDAPEHADAQVPEQPSTPEEAVMLETLEKEAGVAPEVAADASAPAAPEAQLWVEPVGEPFKEITLGFDAPAHADAPVPAHASTEARERAAALDAEYATARAEVAEHGYRRTVHCRKCGTVVSLGEACPVDALIAA